MGEDDLDGSSYLGDDGQVWQKDVKIYKGENRAEKLPLRSQRPTAHCWEYTSRR